MKKSDLTWKEYEQYINEKLKYVKAKYYLAYTANDNIDDLVVIDLKGDRREGIKTIDRMYKEYTYSNEFNLPVKKYSLLEVKLPFNYGYGCPEAFLGKKLVKQIFNTLQDRVARKFLAYQRYTQEENDIMFAIYLYDRAWLELYKKGEPITLENLLKMNI